MNHFDLRFRLLLIWLVTFVGIFRIFAVRVKVSRRNDAPPGRMFCPVARFVCLRSGHPHELPMLWA